MDPTAGRTLRWSRVVAALLVASVAIARAPSQEPPSAEQGAVLVPMPIKLTVRTSQDLGITGDMLPSPRDLATWVSEELRRIGAFRVVERGSLDGPYDEYDKMVIRGDPEGEIMKHVGNLLTADLFLLGSAEASVSGSLLGRNCKVALNAHLVHGRTFEWVGVYEVSYSPEGDDAKGPADEVLRRALREAIHLLAMKLVPGDGMIVSMDPCSVVVRVSGLGSRRGLRVGQILKARGPDELTEGLGPVEGKPVAYLLITRLGSEGCECFPWGYGHKPKPACPDRGKKERILTDLYDALQPGQLVSVTDFKEDTIPPGIIKGERCVERERKQFEYALAEPQGPGSGPGEVVVVSADVRPGGGGASHVRTPVAGMQVDRVAAGPGEELCAYVRPDANVECEPGDLLYALSPPEDPHIAFLLLLGRVPGEGESALSLLRCAPWGPWALGERGQPPSEEAARTQLARLRIGVPVQRLPEAAKEPVPQPWPPTWRPDGPGPIVVPPPPPRPGPGEPEPIPLRTALPERDGTEPLVPLRDVCDWLGVADGIRHGYDDAKRLYNVVWFSGTRLKVTAGDCNVETPEGRRGLAVPPRMQGERMLVPPQAFVYLNCKFEVDGAAERVIIVAPDGRRGYVQMPSP
ncbi:MAG: hypothetical protein FJX75_12110 [Armatimonadetes bacterium]|nr:hypothetical protein [Armatimonadota bacterium]